MSKTTPMFAPGQRVHAADLDRAARRVRDHDAAVLVATYRNQNTATTAAPRLRKRLTLCRTAAGQALNLTSRKVDGVTGVFGYLTDDQLVRLVEHFDYIGGE